MDSAELLDQFRFDVSDTEAPYLWSDPEILTALDDAQKMFCRLTGGLGDASSALTQLAITPDTDWYAYSPLILKVRDAHWTDDGREVEVINFEDLRRRGLRFNGQVGPVRGVIIGLEAHKLRCWPFPDAPRTLQLTVDRLPLKRITDTGQKLEIDEQHHLHLLKWVKALAYRKQDAETYDKGRATDFENQFRVYCEDAKAEKDRAMHKTRVVAYGGI